MSVPGVEVLLTALLTGMAMGLASSLHCAGMCGPIACAMLMATPGQDRDPLVSLMTAQAGRILGYAGLGAAFGIFGAGLYGVANFQLAHSVLQWSAGLTIIWFGLAIAGLVPAMAGLDRLFAPLAATLGRWRALGLGHGYGGLGVAGLVWGLTPCAMVYAALFNSLLAGSVAAGTALMLGFGLGTLPSVTLAGMGLFRMGRLTATASGRLWAGFGLVAAGALGLLLTAPGSPLCITGA